MRHLIIAAAVAAALAGAASAAEVRVTPGDFLVLNPAEENRGISDLVVQGVVIRTGPRERLKVRTVRLELMRGAQVLSMRDLTGADAAKATAGLAALPVRGLLAAQLLDNDPLAGLTLASSADLAPSQVLVLTGIYLSIDTAPDTLRVTVIGTGAGGAPRRAQAIIPVRPYRSPIRYRLPLQGNWLEASYPILQSHHRFIPSNEFAADFFKVNGDGMAWHDDSDVPADWYGWGQPVSAAADGVVVTAVGDQAQDPSLFRKAPGESDQAFGARVEAAMGERLRANFRAALAGNLVTIRHEAGGVVEYSSYAHLKPGSLKVKVGDRVVQGQVIAEVGDTGDSPVTHLHFQINAGPDAFTSRSLPFSFADTRWAGSTRDPGHFIRVR